MTAARTPARRVRGFSLLEALVAMAIASIAFAALYKTVGQSTKTAVDVDSRVQAALLARSVLASATFAEDLLKQPTGETGGWRWSIQAAPTQIAVVEQGHDPMPPLQAAAVRVEVSRDGRSVLTWNTWKPYRSVP
ncbi:MAG: type II secretion system protein [Proteobacteria bacterium]|nr:type II secretion system protein [Pseudomonadota bacterium]